MLFADIPDDDAVSRLFTMQVRGPRLWHDRNQSTGLGLAATGAPIASPPGAAPVSIAKPSARATIARINRPSALAARIARSTSACVTLAGRPAILRAPVLQRAGKFPAR